MTDVRYGPIAVQAVAGSDGIATVRFPGPSQWELLEVDMIALAVTGSTALPEARLYSTFPPAAGTLLATDLDGASGAFSRTGASDAIQPGQTWCVQWTAATAGAVCVATLTGTIKRR